MRVDAMEKTCVTNLTGRQSNRIMSNSTSEVANQGS